MPAKEQKFLVLTGDEYGVNLLDAATPMNFITDKDEADKEFDKLLDAYGCAAMFEVLPNELKLVKTDNNFV